MSIDMDWGDSQLKKMSTKMTDWYKCILGHKDIIRVVANCDTVHRHNWVDGGGGFRTCHCSREDHGTCPVCDRESSLKNHNRPMTYATVICHLVRQANEGRANIIGKLLAWRFGDDKKTDLLEIHEIAGGLKKVDLRLTVKGSKPDDEKYQKLSIKNMSESVILKFPETTKAQILALISNEAEIKKYKRLYHPTPEELMKSMRFEEEIQTFDPKEASWDSSSSGVITPEEVKNSTLHAMEESTHDAFNAGDDPLAGVLT